MGTISIYFKKINEPENDDYFQEFIVWTSDRGVQSYIRGGPNSRERFGSNSGGGSGSSGFDVEPRGDNVPFGSIVVQTGLYKKGSPDYPRAQDDAYPQQVVKSGPDSELEAFWNKMVLAGNAVNKANVSYAFAGPNSNTVATTRLQAAALPSPQNTGLDGATPAPGGDMSLLDRDYSAGRGYDELAGNAVARGFRDIGHDVGAMTSEFRRALKAAAAKRSAAIHGMGLYDAALAAGRPGLGGVAPVAGVAGRLAAQKSRVVASVGEAGFAAAGLGGVQADAGALVARQSGGAETSFRALVAQARHQAADGRARREADAAALHLPVRGAALAGRSFAPPPGGGGGAAGRLSPARPGAAGAPGLRRRRSVHDAVSAAAAAAMEHGEAESQEFLAGADPAPAAVEPADIERALENYFFRQSRLPPAGGAGFNPLLSPAWAGLKIPG